MVPMETHNLSNEQLLTRRPRGRPRDPKLTDEERRAHRRFKPNECSGPGVYTRIRSCR